MQKPLDVRAMLLAGASLVVFGGIAPSLAEPVTPQLSKPADIIAPEPSSKTAGDKFVPRVTRSVTTRTLTTSKGTTTEVIESSDPQTPVTPQTPVVQQAPTAPPASVTAQPRPEPVTVPAVAAQSRPEPVAAPAVAAQPRSEPVATPAAPVQPRSAPIAIASKPAEATPVPANTEKSAKRSKSKTADKADKPPTAAPLGTLHVIVSIDQQRATLYSNGLPVASSKVSTGTKTHPTPMGVFSVIQKNRHHISNLYHAPMPYMQRLTWSGTAMHTGPLPGYPASHGCIRLTDEFAQMLWKATKIGARVIVTREEVKPVEFAHAKLLVPKAPPAMPTPVLARPMETTGTPVRTADATGTVTPDATSDTAPNPNAEPAIDPRVRAVEAMPSLQEMERRSSPVSIFISRKDGKLYVRQAMQPLFDLPISLRDPDQPIGTHVYTAMEIKDGAMRWTSVTIPSSFVDEASSIENRAKRKNPPKETTGSAIQLQPSSAGTALDRFDMPQEAIERLSPLLIPGSSLIVSDNGIGGETGRYTDFIVLTR